MAKQGVYKIEGNTSPKIGEKAIYKVVEWYPSTPISERNPAKVTWELFIEENGKFRSTNLKKKVGEFTFGKNADKFTYKVEGYLHGPEGKEPMSLVVKPQKNDAPKTASRDILGVRLTYQDGSAISKTLSYQDHLRATAKCQNLEGEYIIFELWEDDESGSGHNRKNQSIIKSPPISVDSRGYARWDFTLSKTFISLAQKREGDDKKHEYYVTAEYNGKILEGSKNINVANPEPRITITPKLSSNKAKPQASPNVGKPKPRPDSAKGSTHQGSKNNQPDNKGIITSVKLTDLKGNAFRKRPSFGERIQLVIEGKSIKGKSYRLRIWEDDTTGKNDLLYNREHKFNSDKQIVYIDLTEDMQRIGEIGNDKKNPDSGEYWTGNYQEIFAEVIFLSRTAQSQTINVDLKTEAKKQENARSASMVKDVKAEKKEENEKNGCFCNRDIKPDELIKLGISKKNTSKFLDSINSTMKEYNINTCERKLHFLAQIRHESAEFVYQEEIASGAAYEGRRDLGNTQPGDGKRFKGRGLIQITGRTNYTNYEKYKKINFTTEPNNQKLEQLPYCTDSAGWYWSKCLSEDLNEFADKDDIIYISYRINGGFNGYLSDRKPKLISMIKSIKCKNVVFENFDSYSIKTSNAWNKYDAVYKYAKLNTDESKDSYKRFLELTDDYLTWASVKKSKKKKLRIENQRRIANEKIK